MDQEKIIKVTNRYKYHVGYSIPELHVNRQFAGRETKSIPFKELQSLVYQPGGLVMLKNYLVVKDKEALEELGLKIEPEYFYTEQDVKRLLTTASLNEFLDCLDFAPDGIIDMIKDMAVSLPLNDVSKIKAIQKKTGFNVTRAIEIQEYKYDGGEENKSETETIMRRAPAPAIKEERRVPVSNDTLAPEYKIISQQEK